MGTLLTLLAILVWIIPCFIIAGLFITLLSFFAGFLFKHLFSSGLILAIIMAIYFVCLY